jgi:hypothetical protein
MREDFAATPSGLIFSLLLVAEDSCDTASLELFFAALVLVFPVLDFFAAIAFKFRFYLKFKYLFFSRINSKVKDFFIVFEAN